MKMYLKIGFVLLSMATTGLHAAPRIVTSGTTVGSGDDYVVVDDQGVETAGTVVVEQGGIAAFVTDGDSQIKLKPGFRATPSGSGKFTALATSDASLFNQFYDLMTDQDGDGIEDALEILFGLNPFDNDATGDLDGDTVSNEDEIAAGTDPMSDNTWYTPASDPGGTYDGDPIYIVDPNGSGHDLQMGSMTLN